MPWLRLFLLFSLLGHQPSHATIKYSKLWGLLSYNGHYGALLYLVEPQLRLVNHSEVLEQFLNNTGFGYALNPELQVWLGQTFANFAGNNEVTEDVANNDSTEYRLWQQMLWQHEQKFGQIQVRTRLEERYSLENAPWSLRLRSRPSLRLDLSEHHAIVIFDELFINLKQVDWVVTNTLDQNRLAIGVLQRLNPNTSFTVSYFNQYIFRTPAESNHGIIINVIFQY